MKCLILSISIFRKCNPLRHPLPLIRAPRLTTLGSRSCYLNLAWLQMWLEDQVNHKKATLSLNYGSCFKSLILFKLTQSWCRKISPSGMQSWPSWASWDFRSTMILRRRSLSMSYPKNPSLLRIRGRSMNSYPIQSNSVSRSNSRMSLKCRKISTFSTWIAFKTSGRSKKKTKRLRLRVRSTNLSLNSTRIRPQSQLSTGKRLPRGKISNSMLPSTQKLGSPRSTHSNGLLMEQYTKKYGESMLAKLWMTNAWRNAPSNLFEWQPRLLLTFKASNKGFQRLIHQPRQPVLLHQSLRQLRISKKRKESTPHLRLSYPLHLSVSRSSMPSRRTSSRSTRLTNRKKTMSMRRARTN